MRKWFFAGLAAFAAGTLTLSPEGGLGLGTEASASVAILMSLDELTESSTDVVVGTPVEQKSQWEDLPSGRRIVTYTRVVVDESLSSGSRSEVWVRTLGGKVGRIGQQVSGEADIALDHRALFFLADADDGAGHPITVVVGMAQGHFPLDESGAEPVLRPSPDAGLLLPRRGPSISAREVLVGKRLGEARTLVGASLARKLEAEQKRKAK
jgi:hypothetical protein